MANDLFGGLGNLGGALGGIVSGLAKSGLTSSDDPAVKLLNAQNEVMDLQKQEAEILTEIGAQAFDQNPGQWPQADKLNLVRANLRVARQSLATLKQEQEIAQKAQEAEDAKGRCPECGHHNEEGIKFCQECGTKIGSSFCVGCGAELAQNTRFCGTCGAKQGE